MAQSTINVTNGKVVITGGTTSALDLQLDSVSLIKLNSNNTIDLLSTQSLTIPVGTTSQRPSTPIAGMIRYNSDLNSFEGYTTSWGAIGGSSGGTSGSTSGTGVVAGGTSVGYVLYNGTTQTPGEFYGGTTAPNGVIRLNYDGYLYATRFYGDGSNITSLNGSNISSGIITPARLGSGTATSSTYLRGDGTWATVSTVGSEIDTLETVTGRGTTTATALTFTNTNSSTSTTTGALVITGGLGVGGAVYASSFNGNGANLTSLNANNLATGLVPSARLGTGSASSSTYLRGDGTWAAISGGGTVTETDTLSSVTGRGATTASAISITNSNSSTSTSSGALVITGGLGVGGAVYASSFNGNGANLTALNANNINSGIISPDRLGTGSASSSTYLRGDGTWAAISGGGTLVESDTLATVTSRSSTSNSIISLTNGTNSVSATTGTLLVQGYGGIGVGGNIHCGGNVTANIITGISFLGNGLGLTNLSGNNIASGTVPTARLGSGTASSSTYLRGDGTWASVTSTSSDTLATVTGRGSSTSVAVAITNTTASNNTVSGALTVSGGIGVGGNISCGGNINANMVTATNLVGSGAAITNLTATNLSSGTVPTARLGSGTASSSTYLRGDGTWASVTSTSSDTLATVTGRGATTSSAISITNATATGNTTTGALIVTGGVGIGHGIRVGADIGAAGIISASGGLATLGYVQSGGPSTSGFLNFHNSTVTQYIGTNQYGMVDTSHTGFRVSQNTAVWGFVAGYVVTQMTSTMFGPASASISLGSSSNRWTAVYSANGTIQTSDQRTKDFYNETPGLDFISKLTPYTYKFKVGSVIQEESTDQFETIEIDDENEVIEYEYTTIINEDGANSVVRKQISKKEPIYIEVEVVDENGNTTGEVRRIVKKKKIQVPKKATKEIPGERLHWGLNAQEVKAVIDELGIDFGGWSLADKDDPNSLQSLRYDQFIAPLIQSVKQLKSIIDNQQTTIDTLQSQINALK